MANRFRVDGVDQINLIDYSDGHRSESVEVTLKRSERLSLSCGWAPCAIVSVSLSETGAQTHLTVLWKPKRTRRNQPNSKRQLHLPPIHHKSSSLSHPRTGLSFVSNNARQVHTFFKNDARKMCRSVCGATYQMEYFSRISEHWRSFKYTGEDDNDNETKMLLKMYR